MSTDRELLELAAKAAGVPANLWADVGEILSDKGGWVQSIGFGSASIWNPLNDDGDALRLAVRLNLWDAVRMAHRMLGADGASDLYAATRRAIVRAAAEIGRAMP